MGDSIFSNEGVGTDVASWEVGHRIAARFVQEHDVLAVGDPFFAEPDAHPAAQRLGEQQSFRQRLGCEEVPYRPGGEWTLLPCQTHRVVLSPESRLLRR